jgi:transposase InsO family protein
LEPVSAITRTVVAKLSARGIVITRTPKIVKAVVDLVMDVVKKHLLNPDNVRVKTAWGFLHDLCKEKALPTPSYKWFVRFVRRLPAYQLVNARGGAKLAYNLEARVGTTELALAMAPDRIWQRAHIDHTLVDLETMFPGSTDNAGRVWATLMLDHHSRRVLACFLSYEPPSYRSVMGVIRDCVRRWGRLPESLMLDGGKEFQGLWLQALCSRYHVNLQYRPPCKPRFGAQVERFIGTLNTNLIHFLKGNTQLRKNVRQMTKAVDPDRFAIWSFSELCDLIEEYLFEVYDNLKHRELLASPRTTFERSRTLSGHREIHVVPYNRNFVLATCPSPRKGTARVQGDGVKINYLYYSSPGFQAYLGRDVEVRYDPGNLGVAYAFVSGEWVRLTCTRHAKLVWGLTERQLQAFTTEWRKQRSDVEKERLTDSTLIQFLKKVYDQQTVLVARRQAAEERQRLLAAGALPEDWDEEGLPYDAGGSDFPLPDEAHDQIGPAKPIGKGIVIKPMEFF